MHVSRTSVEIARPLDVVFDYVATPRNWPCFWPLTLSVSGAIDRPVGAGDRCVEQARILGWRGAFHWEVTEAIRPTHLVLRGYSREAGVLGTIAPQNPSQITYALSSSGAGTRFDREMTYPDSNLLVKAADWLGFGREVDKLTGIAMRALTNILEDRLLGAPSLDPTAPELLRQTDTLGDAAVAALVGATGDVAPARRLLGEIYRGTVSPDNLPAGPFREFFEKMAALPPWVDPDRVAVAEELFLEWGLLAIASLACASLPETYSLPGIARVLNMTGELDTGRLQVHRRIIFTTRMVFDVMRRGGLAPGGAGVRAAQRVRLLHAIVRLLLGHRVDAAGRVQPIASGALWGHMPGRPINQMELAFTLQTFGYVILRSLERFHCELTPFQRESYLHVWNIVGWLVGVREDLLPQSIADAQQQFDALHARYARSSPEAAYLAGALVGFWTDLFPFGSRWCARRLMHGLVCELVPAPTREMLGLPHLPSFSPAMLFLVDGVGRLATSLSGRAFADFPPAASAAARFMQLGLNLATRRDEAKAGLFDIPEELAARWAHPQGRSENRTSRRAVLLEVRVWQACPPEVLPFPAR